MSGRTVVGAGPPPKVTKAQKAAARKATAATQSSALSAAPAPGEVDDGAATTRKEGGKPDKAAYDAEQESIKAEIDSLQKKLDEVKARISSTGGNSPANERKKELRAQLDTLKGEQANRRGSREKTLEQVKSLQDGLNRKIKELQAQRSKAPFKSVAEADAQIKALEKRVESGTMKLVDEKRALQEITMLKKARKSIETFQQQQDAIEADKRKIDDVRKQLDDPEHKQHQDKWSAIRQELDEINRQQDEDRRGKDSLFEERNAVRADIDAAYARKKESAKQYREANDRYYAKMNEERARRQERLKQERQAHESERRRELNDRLLEEARAPAFEREIEDCRNIIVFFQKRLGGDVSAAAPATGANGTSAHNIRQVDSSVPEGAIALTKKKDEDSYFVGGGGKKAKKQQQQQQRKQDDSLNVPFGTLSALMSMDIQAPSTVADLPKTIEALETKRQWYADNQARVTAEKIAAVEAKIAKSAASEGANGATAETTTTAESA